MSVISFLSLLLFAYLLLGDVPVHYAALAGAPLILAFAFAQRRTATVAICATLVLVAACTHVRAGDLRASTFGTGKLAVTRPDGTRVEAESDGTNVSGIFRFVVDAARRFFSGGDTVINVPPAAPAAPEAPPSPRVLDGEVAQ